MPWYCPNGPLFQNPNILKNVPLVRQPVILKRNAAWSEGSLLWKYFFFHPCSAKTCPYSAPDWLWPWHFFLTPTIANHNPNQATKEEPRNKQTSAACRCEKNQDSVCCQSNEPSEKWLWDNRLSDKWAFGPMGDFSDYRGFRLMGHRNSGQSLENRGLQANEWPGVCTGSCFEPKRGCIFCH